MTEHSKKMIEQHVIDAEAQDLLRSILPKHWVLRDYRPDYGLDFSLEVFREIRPDHTSEVAQQFETLGEHVFIQLKGARKSERRRISIYSRQNVEKTVEQKDKNDLAAKVETLPYHMETSELITVQRMGSALPVLLVRADLETKKCHFVCLNDYIEKILIPRHGNYTVKETRTIHVPSRNDLAHPEIGTTALRWYGKRAKLFAGFQKMAYQQMELHHAAESAEISELARHFATLLVNYDFWEDTPMWEIIPFYGRLLKRFLVQGPSVLTEINEEALEQASQGNQEPKDEMRAHVLDNDILKLWRCLAILPRNYEEVCREWFLPTSLGISASYLRRM